MFEYDLWSGKELGKKDYIWIYKIYNIYVKG